MAMDATAIPAVDITEMTFTAEWLFLAKRYRRAMRSASMMGMTEILPGKGWSEE